ncbi:TatD family hydrolase [Patescibacteria group bacterium]|nr:TatD family deoxyribonuclease [Candidatus Falkowbacteria bacterium]MBU3906537.1 TatD family hydrolase [Patescibacteria group bacterium]MBU4015246.1 TatD family hydrolase [Patescibacteria group bacterium]MBU4026571.1 TatD family hydrolase [Patescibacteria group bacterium]MBU4073470.1 TatD family hydrolase [Patescibacteria group bacterium]
MFIDTHAHINFSAFKQDADEVMRKSLAADTWMVVVGTDYKSSKLALDYANKYEKGVYAAVGLHPIHLQEVKADGEDYNFVSRVEEFNYEMYERLGKLNKAVAIGEIGLDYHHINENQNVLEAKEKQKKVFIEQFKLARDLDLPVIIHCRNAHDDMLAILEDLKNKYKNLISKNRPWGVMHCYSGDENLAWQYFSLGLLISFTGLITFSAQWDDLIRKMPLEKVMIETDCPFMTPEPYRGQRNEPILVKYVAQRIAEIKNLSIERVAEITTKNAREFFGI